MSVDKIMTISVTQSQAIKEISDLIEKLDFWDGEKAVLFLVLASRYMNKMQYHKKVASKLVSKAMDHALAAPYL